MLFCLLYLVNATFNYPSTKQLIYEEENPYYYLQVKEIEDARYLLVSQCGGVRLKSIQGRFFTGRYWDYPLVSTAFTNDTKHVIILGLAAGSTAKSFTAALPHVMIDGVEIDSLVVDIGERYFNMSTCKLNSIISDGRLFVKTTKKQV